MNDLLDRFRRDTEPSPIEAESLARAALRKGPPAPRRAWPVVLGAALVTGAALARVTLAEPPPVELQGNFDAGDRSWGVGRATLTGERIDLHDGVVASRAPGMIDIHTREATVTGRDAMVRVERSALGTAVVVREGVVSVACGDEAPLALVGTRTCLPVSSEGLLARAAALGDSDEARAALDAAVASATSVATLQEAYYQRGALRAWSEPASAVPDFEQVLALGPGSRANDARRALARLAVAAYDCGAALPHLRALDAAGALDEDAVLLAACAPE